MNHATEPRAACRRRHDPRRTAAAARLLAAGVALVVASLAWAQIDPFEEGLTTVPGIDETARPLEMPAELAPVSGPGGLVAYQPDEAGSRQYWVDRPSIVIDRPYVRATIIVESSSGARTISHLGFDCSQGALALLATGQTDGSWHVLDTVQWRPAIGGEAYTPYLAMVYRAVCDGRGPTRTVNQMIQRLRERPGETLY